MTIIKRLRLEGLTTQTPLVVMAAVLLAIAASTLTTALPSDRAFAPVLMVGVLALLGLLATSQQARVLWVVVGGVVALQSSQELDVIKLAYLAGVGASAGFAIMSRNESWGRASRHVLALVFNLSALLTTVILISTIFSLMRGTPPAAALRDIAPFLLLALVPIFAAEANAAFSKGQLALLVFVLGALSSASFGVEWLDRRHYLELPFERIALPSLLLPAALLSYAVSASLSGKPHRRYWEVAGALVVTALLVTGTRVGIVILIAPLVVVALTRGDALERFAALAVRGTIAIVVVWLALVAFTGFSSGGAIDHLSSITGVFSDDAASRSYEMRLEQTQMAWQRLAENPAFGGGPGRVFPWGTPPRESFVIDSPLSFPAKFGLVGAAALAALFFGYFRLGLRLKAEPELTTAAIAFLGFLVVFLAFYGIVSPAEDKGASFGLILLLALSLPKEAAQP